LLRGIWLLSYPYFFFSAFSFTDKPSLFSTMRFCTQKLKKRLNCVSVSLTWILKYLTPDTGVAKMFFETLVGFTRLEQRNTDLMLHL
jgi:hypothetical protein